MAGFGANYPCFKPEDAESGVTLGKLVAANLTVNLASGDLYADDSLAEQVSEFSSGSIAMETDDMEDDTAAVVYGCKVEDGVATYSKDDTAPMGGLAYYKVLMRSGKKHFKGLFYPRVRAALGNDNAQTRGNSITFQTTATTFTVFADESGVWRKTKTCETAEEVKTWINGLCAIAEVAAAASGTDEQPAASG